MRRILFVLLLAAAATVHAQTKTPNPHEHDFDYLLGDWEYNADSIEYGKYHGLWSAVRLDTGQVLDQFRVTGDHGETFYSTTSLRAFNAAANAWELVSTSGNDGVRDFGTARREGNEMRIEQTFGASSKHPSLWRIRYHDIEANHFLWDGDCSTDGGKSWKRCLSIDAHRVGPPRSALSLGPSSQPR